MPRKSGKHQLLMMLDEFPALGRLDFFETSLAFMAGYGIRAFLIAQSLNQIEKAYGEHNSILDNCHVRVAFATNDERTAKRVSDALGTATEQRAMRNYAGHRLAPWLAHVMVSRQETARALLTPGEVMQMPATDELILVSGLPPIKATKLRYYDDPAFKERVVRSPELGNGIYADRPPARPDDWTGRTSTVHASLVARADEATGQADGGLEQQRHPGLQTEGPSDEPPLEAADALGIDDAETDQGEARLIDQSRGAANLAFGVGEGDRSDDLIGGR